MTLAEIAAMLPSVTQQQAFIIGALVIGVAAVWMNRGNSWVLDVLNLDAPVLLGVGVVILLAAPAPWNLAGLIPVGIAAIRRAPDLIDAL